MERRDMAYLGLAGCALVALVTIHGATSREWRQMHTLGVLLTSIAVIGNELL